MLTRLLCALLLAPAPAHRAAPRRPAPRAAPKTPVPLNVGDQVTIGGIVYVVGYSLSPLSVTPPPPVPHLIGFTTNGPTFSAGAILSGTLTLDQPAPVGGAAVTLTSSAPAVLAVSPTVTVAAGATQTTFTAPAGTPAVATPVTLTAQSGGTTQSVTVTVLAGTGVPMNVFGYRDGNRNPALNFGPGQTVFIEGVGFGTTPGTVRVNTAVIPTQKWTDTELEIICPALPAGFKPGQSVGTSASVLDIRRADGQAYVTEMGFVIIPPPVRPAGG